MRNGGKCWSGPPILLQALPRHQQSPNRAPRGVPGCRFISSGGAAGNKLTRPGRDAKHPSLFPFNSRAGSVGRMRGCSLRVARRRGGSPRPT
jgi:hypothetical protein